MLDSFDDQVEEEIKDQDHIFAQFNNQQFKEDSKPETLIDIEDEQIYYKEESIFVTSSEFQSNFEQMNDIIQNVQPANQELVPPLPPQQQQFETDIFVSSEEIQSIFKEESSELTPNSLWVGNNNPMRR